MAEKDSSKYFQGLKQGDPATLSAVYQQYSVSVKSWVIKNNGSLEDAQDVFQEAIMAIYQKLSEPDYEIKSPFGALLLTICKNKWIDQLRKKKREREVRNANPGRLFDESVTEHDLAAIEEAEIKQLNLQKAFDQLSELCQRLLKLAIAEIKPVEIAQQLEMSGANAVYRRKKACTDRWRLLYQEQNLY